MQLQPTMDNEIAELNDNEIDLVSGGHVALIAAAAAYGAGAAIFTAGYTVGSSIGKAIYYMSH